MKYLLDSNIIIALTMNADDRVVRRDNQKDFADIPSLKTENWLS